MVEEAFKKNLEGNVAVRLKSGLPGVWEITGMSHVRKFYVNEKVSARGCTAPVQIL